MLPLGWLTDPGIKLFSLYRILVFLFFYFRVYLLHFWTFTGALVGPHRWCSLTRAEQRTQVSLASPCESPSPLMFPVEFLERKAAEHTRHISGHQQLFSYCHAFTPSMRMGDVPIWFTSGVFVGDGEKPANVWR